MLPCAPCDDGDEMAYIEEVRSNLAVMMCPGGGVRSVLLMLRRNC
jgi:hypothetical protein